MGEKVEQQLKEVGSKLETPPTSKDALIKLLKQATTCLPGIDQSPSTSTLESLQPFLDAIVKPDLLKHQDRDVKLLVATCVCEITRITAPQAPYSDDILKEIFHLIVGTFSGLSNTGSPSFGRRVFILDTLAKYRSCVVMLDLECEDLVNNMFSTFFAVAKDDHQENVLSSMQKIMIVLIEESEDIREDLLLIILSVLGRNRTDVSGAARRLAMNVIESCAGKLEPSIKQCLLSLMPGDNRLEHVKIDYHEVIYDVYRCAPQILSGIVPYLTGELLSDQLDTRLKAVGLVGELFALPKGVITEAFQPIFLEFVKRLTDREVGVRMSVLEYLKTCLLSNPSRAEASQIISALCDRLLDYDENVRKQVVDVICNVACASLDSIPTETVKLVAERLRDKSLFVKKHTMERIAEIFRVYCMKHSDGPINHNEFDWIPGKILRCLYDRDFRSDVIESVLCGSLFPADFSVKDRVSHWVKIFSLFDKVEVKALEKILEQKQRLQLEMQKYLALRKIHQDGDAPEIQKKVQFCFRLMSRLFAEPAKAEENFQILDQLKDSNIWKILTNLLDPNTSFNQASLGRDELLKILGEKHRLHDFLSNLSLKCSYLLFNKEHVKELLEAVTHRSTGNSLLTQSCMDLLVIIARFSPILFGGSEEELVNLLKDEDDIIKESALNILVKAGGTIREQIPPSSIDLISEGFCLEGSRRQAKNAIHALVAITKDDGLKSLSVLYKRLVDMLEERRHLPAVMQSLGCIAEAAMPVFETRESEIQDFIKSKILNCSSKAEDSAKVNWDDRSEVCLLKIYGIKTLVKSYLPVKDAQLRPGIDNLIGILRSIFLFGEISKDIESSSVDKAHLRFAAAKAVLRLSKQWDHKIPVDVFHLTVVMPEFTFPEARKLFLGKVYQYIKDRLLDTKYACAFLFNKESFESLDSDERQNLTDIIQMHHQAKARQVSLQSDANPLEAYPEYILPYLVHTLAHHSCPNNFENKDVKAFEPLYRQLYLFLSVLLHKDEDVKSETSASKEKESVSTMVSIFQIIKNSEDQVDVEKSKNSHCIAEFGLSIVKRLVQKVDDVQESKPLVPLPPMLYKQHESTEDVEAEANKGKTWLPDESFLAHFESLKFDAGGTVILEIVEDGISKDSETEANEVPLGKIIKQLKSESKSGKVRKEKSSPAKEKKAESGVDVLKMVREINLDSLGSTSKFESSNGHNHFESEDNLEQQKEKRKAGDVTPVSVPKKRRSLSIHNASRSSQKVPRTFPVASNHDARVKKAAPEVSIESTDSDLLVSSIKKGRSTTSNRKRRNSDLDSFAKTTELGEAEDTSDVETDRVTANVLKSPTGSLEKRKRSIIIGLEKCKAKETGVDFEELAGHRIKVWWPMDKKFYEGTIKSFDPLKRKHVILYDDGDIEVLNLERERWELVGSGPKQSKKPKSSKRPTSMSPAQKNKKSSSSRKNIKSVKIEKPKGTPKKKKVLEGKHEEKDDSIGSERKSGDSDEKSAEPRAHEVSDKEESDKEVLSDRRSKKLGDGKKSPTLSDDSDGESNSNDNVKVSQESAEEDHYSEAKETDDEALMEEANRDESNSEDDQADKELSDSEDVERRDVVRSAGKGLTKSKKANKKTSKTKRKREPEISDDEPLLKWKQKAGKLRKLAK